MLFVNTNSDPTLWQGVLPGWEEALGYRSVEDMFQVKFQVTNSQAAELMRFYREFSGNAIGGLAEACKVMSLWMISNVDPSSGMGEEDEPEEMVEDVAEESED